MGTSGAARTEQVRGSELYDRVLLEIVKLRDPDYFKKYQAELRTYKRRLGKRDEVDAKQKGLLTDGRTRRGFVVKVMDRDVFIERPSEPSPAAFRYYGYDRSFGFRARSAGVLSDSTVNRDIRPQRVDEYREVMERGEWRDLLSDPITITEAGAVVNGQRRLAAACDVDWSKVTNDPAFLVVWGVNPLEATFADLSRRTPKDQAQISSRSTQLVVQAAQNASSDSTSTL